MNEIEYRIELGNTFHVFKSNNRWWTPDRAEAEQDLKLYANNPQAQIEEWRNGEFYRIVRVKAA